MRLQAVAPILLAAAVLCWPAVWNGYPLVFSDTGTYLSQVPHHYLGWDRPPFYSAFLLALDWDVTTWPVVAAQALIAAWVLDALRRGFAPEAARWRTAAMGGALALASPLPWLASKLMPDLFTGLMVAALVLLALRPERFGRWERRALQALVWFAVVVHLSDLPLVVALVPIAYFVSSCPRKREPRATGTVPHPWVPAFAGMTKLLGAPVLAGMAALCVVNFVGRGIFEPAPYGNLFLLARIIADGPGVRTLQRDCPRTHWRLCPWRDAMPASADALLWRHDSPLNRAGGPKAVSADADAIIAATVRDEPLAVLADAARNTLRQLARFASGDGLRPWPATVAPWIVADFPKFEQRAYAADRQTRGLSLLPGWMGWLHRGAELAAALGCVTLLPWLWRHDRALGGAMLVCLFALLVNAAVTGALSGPHDRYQSRVMWLPLAMVLLVSRRPR